MSKNKHKYKLMRAIDDTKTMRLVLRDCLAEHGLPLWLADLVRAGPDLVDRVHGGRSPRAWSDADWVVDRLTAWIGSTAQKVRMMDIAHDAALAEQKMRDSDEAVRARNAGGPLTGKQMLILAQLDQTAAMAGRYSMVGLDAMFRAAYREPNFGSAVDEARAELQMRTAPSLIVNHRDYSALERALGETAAQADEEPTE